MVRIHYFHDSIFVKINTHNTHAHTVADIPNLAGKDYIYKLHEDPQDNTSLVCFHASFIMNFTISYNVLNETSTSSILEVRSTKNI